MDTEAFERVAREHKDRVYGYAALMLRDRTEAQDVAQEALVRLWQHRSGLDESGARPWLTRITHNLCIDRIRGRHTRSSVSPETLEYGCPDTAPGPLDLARAAETGRAIEEALLRLDPIDRAVVVMREVQDRPYDEIASALGMPLGTLKARLHRARERLRTRLVRAGVTP